MAYKKHIFIKTLKVKVYDILIATFLILMLNENSSLIKQL
jgi:hypothetical protein